MSTYGIVSYSGTLETIQYANERGKTYPAASAVRNWSQETTLNGVDVRLATIVSKFLFVPLNPTRYLLLFSST